MPLNSQPCNLLVLDSDADFRDTVARRYARRGYSVHQQDAVISVPDAEAAKPWDVVLIRLGAGPNVAIEELLRKNAATSAFQLVVIGGREIFESGLETLPAATTDVLLKPLIWTELDWRMQKARERAEQVKELLNLRNAVASGIGDGGYSVGDERTLPLATSSGHERSGSAGLDTLALVQRSHILEILERENWNKARTARALGVNRRSLYRLIEKFKIKLGTQSDTP